jgi:hypothetical protein
VPSVWPGHASDRSQSSSASSCRAAFFPFG